MNQRIRSRLTPPALPPEIPPAPECPECEKMQAVKDQSQAIGEFLEWLMSTKKWVVAERHQHTGLCYDEDDHKSCGFREGELHAASFQIEALLAEYFKIDMKKVDREKEAILDYLRRNTR